MTIDATFWVMISFFLFIGLLIYFQIPQKIRKTLEENILSIKNQIEDYIKKSDDFTKSENTMLSVKIDQFAASSIDIRLICFT